MSTESFADSTGRLGQVEPGLPVITLLTDFGTADYFVGAMKGVILTINRSATIVDITHEIPPQDIESGAFTLLTCYRDFPDGTIHVGVVDPELAELDGAPGRSQPRDGRPEELPVHVDVRTPLVRDVADFIDGLHRAHRNACAALHALVRLDVALAEPVVDAVDRALLHARTVVHVDAGFGDHVRHGVHLQVFLMRRPYGAPCKRPAAGR